MLNKLVQLFRPYKKGMGVAHYLTYLDRNKGLNFQMDFLRSRSFMDLQVSRYKLIVPDDILESHSYGPNDYVLSLSFTKLDDNSKESFNRFKQSHLFDESQLTYQSKDKSTQKFNLYMEEDNKKLFEYIKSILEEVYNYDKNTTYQILFHKFE